jgi:hypothetical protein
MIANGCELCGRFAWLDCFYRLGVRLWACDCCRGVS